MTSEMLNDQLYEKIAGEQEQYKAYLLTLQPEEILKHADEFACRENIMLAMENSNLEDRRAKALLKCPTPLADIYRKYSGWDHSGQMDLLWNAVEARAGEIVRA